MSLVVSDSGPIHYLVLCRSVHVLPVLYDQLVIPSAVAHELDNLRTPEVVRQWIHALPEWATIRAPEHVERTGNLGLGECEAIALAVELNATQLLIDDRAARRMADSRGILTVGTIGIIERAAAAGLLNIAEVLRDLLATNFRIDADVVREVLERNAGE